MGLLDAVKGGVAGFITGGPAGAAVGAGSALLKGSGDSAARATGRATEASLQAQREALDYLREVNRVPQHMREEALQQLGQFYGLSAPPAAQGITPEHQAAIDELNQLQAAQGIPGRFGGNAIRQATDPRIAELQQQIAGFEQAQQVAPQQPMGLVQQVQQSPFYESMIQQGQDAVLRGASATGGLRSGNVQQALAQSSQNVLQGLVNQRLQGLQGMAQLPTNTNQIAQGMQGLGTTRAQGITAAAQAKQAGLGQGLDFLMQGVRLGAQEGWF